MKNLFYFIISFFLVACSNQDLDQYIADTKLYSSSAEVINVEAVGSDNGIMIENYTSWTARTGNDWIKIINSHGSNQEYLNFVVESNVDKNIREGQILIFCEGKHVKTYNIKQECSYINCSQDSMSISNKAANLKVSIESNGHWKVVSEASWISSETQEGISSKEIIINITNNPTGKERTGIIKFIDQANNESYFAVTQQGLCIDIAVSELVVGCIENKIDINCMADSDIVFETDSWIACDYSDSKEILSISIVEDNLCSSERVGFIKMYLEGIPDFTPLEITIIQKGVMFGYVDLGIISEDKLILFQSSESHVNLSNNQVNNYTPVPVDGFTRNYEGFPTKEEFNLLINHSHKPIKINGRSGYVFVGSNGNSVFVPYGRYWDSSVKNGGDWGYYYEFSESGIKRNHDGGLILDCRGLFVKRTDVE